MRSKVKLLVLVVGGAMLAPAARGDIAEAQLESYQLIPERNAFGLRPAPPQPDPAAQQPPQPAVKVTFTALTDTYGVKKAYFMMPDTAHPGQFLYYALREGEQDGTIRVIEGGIDEKSGTVKIVNGGTPMTLSFEKDGNKAVAGPVIAPPGGINPGQPVVGPQGVPNMSPQFNPAQRIPTVPGPIPAANSALVNPQAANPNTTPIPTRSLRTLPAAARAQVVPQQTLEESIINLEAQRLINADKIATGEFPPLPPTPISDTGGSTPPQLPGFPQLPGQK